MRSSGLVGLFLLIAGCGAHGLPQPNPMDTQARPLETRNVYCFVDGHTASCDHLQGYAPASIERIEVLKGVAAAERYGPEADGAILVSTMRSPDVPRPAADPDEAIFYFIDGRTAARADFERLAHTSIERIEVLKRAAAVSRYGSEASAGVILITTKRNR